MDVLDGPHYHQCKMHLSVFGVWPLQSGRSKLLLRATSYVVWLTIFVPTLCKAYELRHHFYYFLLCVPNLIYYTRYFVKLTYLIFNDSQFRHLLRLIGKDFHTYTGHNLAILQRYAKQAARANKIYAYCMLLFTCTFDVSSFVPNPPDSPHLTMHSFVLDMFATLLIVGFNALMLNCVQHGCALFRIVVQEMKYVLHRNDCKSTSALYEEITKIIELHKHAIQFDFVESTYSSHQLLMVGFTLAAITISEFQIATNRPHGNVRFRFLVYGAGELLHVLFHNFPGQRIRDHSLMIYQSCYHLEWYRDDVPKECRKLLCLMMLRSQKSCCLTGGGFYVLGLENYIVILKASLKYFTFFSSMQ